MVDYLGISGGEVDEPPFDPITEVLNDLSIPLDCVR